MTGAVLIYKYDSRGFQSYVILSVTSIPIFQLLLSSNEQNQLNTLISRLFAA